MITSFLANPYVVGFGYLIGIVSGIIAIVQTFRVSEREKEIRKLNIKINSSVSNNNQIYQGKRSQYFQDNNGPVNIDNRG
ncbi:hypothetical protein ID852_15775 [Xenorhabdus sp. 42]|uniref:hypothetical protein n=1 Tax=Xenorhabdus szentirmaii TaxID=290112 RepID=UPI0019BFC634|nr:MULTISPECIES: hypothetical protein [unclassified Xenorhabdus]MBD2794472.1 hypothetical protein [Xenorhabdus sp. CUL]MBD2822116.1 hypothetical protein [Xenorhabdus sp. 42]MBD2826851.1 hypothetical protein [Xenorhabdus sp. 5]